MENSNDIKIDPKKFYDVEIIKVMSTYRVNYNRQALQLFFHIKELNRNTSRTLDLPKTFKASSTVWRDVIGNIAEEAMNDDLLEKPNKLATEVANHVCNKTLKARLGLSLNGKYIDILEVSKPEE